MGTISNLDSLKKSSLGSNIDFKEKLQEFAKKNNNKLLEVISRVFDPQKIQKEQRDIIINLALNHPIDMMRAVGGDVSMQTKLGAEGAQIFFEKIIEEIKNEYPEYTKAEEKQIYDLSEKQIKVKIINQNNKDKDTIEFNNIELFNKNNKTLTVNSKEFNYEDIMLIKNYDSFDFKNKDKLLIKNLDDDFIGRCKDIFKKKKK